MSLSLSACGPAPSVPVAPVLLGAAVFDVAPSARPAEWCRSPVRCRSRLVARARFAGSIRCASLLGADWTEALGAESERIIAARIRCDGTESDLVELELLDPRGRFSDPVIDKYLRITASFVDDGIADATDAAGLPVELFGTVTVALWDTDVVPAFRPILFGTGPSSTADAGWSRPITPVDEAQYLSPEGLPRGHACRGARLRHRHQLDASLDRRDGRSDRHRGDRRRGREPLAHSSADPGLRDHRDLDVRARLAAARTDRRTWTHHVPGRMLPVCGGQLGCSSVVGS